MRSNAWIIVAMICLNLISLPTFAKGIRRCPESYQNLSNSLNDHPLLRFAILINETLKLSRSDHNIACLRCQDGACFVEVPVIDTLTQASFTVFRDGSTASSCVRGYESLTAVIASYISEASKTFMSGYHLTFVDCDPLEMNKPCERRNEWDSEKVKKAQRILQTLEPFIVPPKPAQEAAQNTQEEYNCWDTPGGGQRCEKIP